MNMYSHTMSNYFDQLRNCNTLIRLSIIKDRGLFLNFSARILAVDPSKGTLLLYDVDGKKVEHVSFTEIDDLSPHQYIFEKNLEKT